MSYHLISIFNFQSSFYSSIGYFFSTTPVNGVCCPLRYTFSSFTSTLSIAIFSAENTVIESNINKLANIFSLDLLFSYFSIIFIFD